MSETKVAQIYKTTLDVPAGTTLTPTITHNLGTLVVDVVFKSSNVPLLMDFNTIEVDVIDENTCTILNLGPGYWTISVIG